MRHWILPLLTALTCASTAIADSWDQRPLEPLHASLEDSGVVFDSIITQDIVTNLHGGLRERTAEPGDFDLMVTVDTEKANFWKNGSFFIYGQANWGSAPSRYVGDLQGTNNIEAIGGTRVAEAWYNHQFLDGSLQLLFGLHDVNSEFQVLNSASHLLNNSFSMSPDVTQVPLSTWPITSLGARLRYDLTDTAYAQTAVYDGIPGDPDKPRGTHIRFDSGDGFFWIAEGGIRSPEDDTESPSYKLAQGGWYQTTEYADFQEQEQDWNAGYYLIGERQIWCEETCERGGKLFAQFGYANPRKNQIGAYWGGGLSWDGALKNRPADNLSFGVAQALNGSAYLDATDAERAETALELSYTLAITPWITVQPDLQYIFNTGTDPAIDNALVSTIRFGMAL